MDYEGFWNHPLVFYQTGDCLVETMWAYLSNAKWTDGKILHKKTK